MILCDVIQLCAVYPSFSNHPHDEQEKEKCQTIHFNDSSDVMHKKTDVVIMIQVYVFVIQE